MARSFSLLVGIAVLVGLSGCMHHHGHRGHGSPDVVEVHRPGPPPHAPAHGYRHRHQHHPDVELVFDSGLGVYVVVGLEDYFFHRDYFYRVIDGVWHRSIRIDHGWLAMQPATRLPPGLAKKHRKARKHHKKHHRHPAKYGY